MYYGSIRLFQCFTGWIGQPGWHGWRLHQGKLISPEGQEFEAGHLYQSHWLHQAVRTLRTDLQRVTGREYDQHHWHGYRYLEKRQA